MKALLKTAITATLFAASQFSLAITVKDQKGDFTLDTVLYNPNIVYINPKDIVYIR